MPLPPRTHPAVLVAMVPQAHAINDPLDELGVAVAVPRADLQLLGRSCEVVDVLEGQGAGLVGGVVWASRGAYAAETSQSERGRQAGRSADGQAGGIMRRQRAPCSTLLSRPSLPTLGPLPRPTQPTP